MGARFKGKGFDPIPMRREKTGRELGAVRFGEGDGLPAVGVNNFVRQIDWTVKCIVAVGLAIAPLLVAQMVGAVVLSVFNDRLRSEIADAFRFGWVFADNRRIVPQFFHRPLKKGFRVWINEK